MKKSHLALILALTCMFGVSVSAHAEDINRIKVTVPFDFVAGGQTLPAGTYSVSRVSDQSFSALAIRNDDSSVFVLPVVFDGVIADHAKLTFEHVGNKYLLSKVDTIGGAYDIRTPEAMTQVAQTKDHGTGSAPGAN
jgi:hypothetical protein